MNEPAADASARPGLRYHALAVAMALLGGAFGIAGAFVQELRTGGGILLLFFGAPIVEEIVKPMGIYLLLLRWPQAVRGRVHSALLGIVAGITFGLLESGIYATIYVAHPSQSFLIFRFTVPVALHAATTGIVGAGIDRRLIAWANGEEPFPKPARNAYMAAMVLHSVYNITVACLAFAGILEFSNG